jgi:hypothetical protein
MSKRLVFLSSTNGTYLQWVLDDVESYRGTATTTFFLAVPVLEPRMRGLSGILLREDSISAIGAVLLIADLIVGHLG